MFKGLLICGCFSINMYYTTTCSMFFIYSNNNHTLENRVTSTGSGFPGWLSDKRIHLPMQEMQETRVQSLGWEDPLEKEMATCSSILAWEILGQRSLACYSPRGCTESDMTEVTQHAMAWCLKGYHLYYQQTQTASYEDNAFSAVYKVLLTIYNKFLNA